MMHLIRRAGRGAAAVLAVAALGACENEIPTATGSDLFPGGLSPTTLSVEFTGSDLLLREEVHEGFGNPRLTPFLIAANNFDGELQARPIARFPEFPDSVTYSSDNTSRRAEIASFAGGRVLVEVDSLASSPRLTTRLVLWELTQPWDSATVSWEHAVDRPGEQVPWSSPGGSIGTMLAVGSWSPNDTITRDTVVWELDSLAVSRLQQDGHPGLIVTNDDLGSRLKLSGLTLALDARPVGDPDTLLVIRTMEGVQDFIYTPATPDAPDVLSTGGLLGNRSILTLDLDQEVEACPAGGGSCTNVSLANVTLNRVQLVLEPRAVAGGHRPLAIPTVQVRRVAEPQLGRFAPLGAVLAMDTISVSAFDTETDREFALDLTSAILNYFADRVRRAREAERNGVPIDLGPPEMNLALLTTYEVPDLGLLWFARSPRLRVVYTLPLNPTLP